MESVIRLDGVEKAFRKRVALAGITLEVAKGSLCCLYGPALAGKSVLLRILAGELRPDRGEVQVLGMTPFGRKGGRPALGFLPENPVYDEAMGVRNYLSFLGRAGGLGGRSLAQRLETTLHRCELGEPAEPIRSLTAEGLARLGIAQTLLFAFPLLILDDPTAGLAGESRRRLEALILSLRGEFTVIYSARSLGWLEESVDSLAAMDRGVLLFHETLSSLRQRYQQPVMRISLGAAPPSFSASLRQQPWLEEIKEEGDSYLLRVHDLEQAARALPKIIADQGLPLWRLEIPKVSLPDLLAQAGRDLPSRV